MIVATGVAGCGKSTAAIKLGELFKAKQYNGVEIIEGDDFHPAENIAKMSSGLPLQDSDRWPWLNSICNKLIQTVSSKNAFDKKNAIIISCSALKRSYRDLIRLRLAPLSATVKLWFLYLHVPPTTQSIDLLKNRLQSRLGHFMPISLVESQLGTLEDPRADGKDDVFTIPFDADETVLESFSDC